MIAVSLGEGHTRYLRGETIDLPAVQEETIATLETLGEASAGQLADTLNINLSTVADRLKRLCKAKKIVKIKVGKFCTYKVNT